MTAACRSLLTAVGFEHLAELVLDKVDFVEDGEDSFVD